MGDGTASITWCHKTQLDMLHFEKRRISTGIILAKCKIGIQHEAILMWSRIKNSKC